MSLAERPREEAYAIRELHEIAADLDELLAIAQPPLVTLHATRRFLEVLVPYGSNGWIAYGERPTVALTRSLETLQPLEGIPLEDLQAVRALLQQLADLALPRGAVSPMFDLPAAALRSLAIVENGIERLTALLSGKEPDPQATEDRAAVLLVPVAVGLRAARVAHPLFAGIRAGQIVRLRVEAEMGRRRAGPDQLLLDGRATAETRAAFCAALSHLGQLSVPGAPRLERCWFRAAWTPGDCDLAGRSASLPFLLAAAAARAALAPGRSARETVAGTAVTSDLDGTRSAPVSEGSLGLKVAACFHASVRQLLVPFEQRQQAQEALRALEAKHPERQLLVRGVRDARDAWGDPGVIRTRTRTAAEACSTLLHRFAASRTFAVVVILAFLVLLLLIFLALRWTHYNPVALDWSKGRDELLVKNQYGFTVLALPIRHQHPNEVSLFGYSRALADLDGDGVKEVIAIHDGREEAFSALSMFDRKKQPVWTRFCNDLSPGIERKVDGLAWFAFLPLELGPGEPARLACLRRSRQGSLSVLEIDDAATGQLLGRMSNIGHIEAIYETDLDRDGRKDLWACGTDNVTGMALLAVLDPAAFRIEEGATRVSDLLGLTDPRSLGAGVLSLVELPKLSYSRSERAQCTTVQIGDDGGVIAGSADPDGNCLFHLRFPDLRAPVLDHVQITDAGRSIIRFRAGRDVPLAEFAAEEAAMAQAARILTPDGWRPCPGGEASQPAPRESEISEIPAGGR